MRKYSFILLLLSLAATADTNNPLFGRQWYLSNTGQIDTIRQEELVLKKQAGLPGMDISWVNTTPGEKETIVAVIDSGIDLEHPDLKGRIVPGKNFLHATDPVSDDTGHGTHVSGIIAANDNDIGIVGVAGRNTQIKIMPLKVLSNATKSFSYKKRLITEYFADAITYAVDNGADVINLSVGFPIIVVNDKLKQAIQYATKKQIPIVVAAGNNNKGVPVYPCSYQEVICVGSIDNIGSYSEFSNFGSRVDILAPGRSIISTYPTNLESQILRQTGYEVKRGTSQAAPIVAAIIAVLKNKNPGLSLDQVKNRIFSTTRPIAATNNKRKSSLFQLVNMKGTLDASNQDLIFPMLKEIDQLVIKKSDLHFEIEIPIKSVSAHKINTVINVKSNDKVTFDQESFPLTFTQPYEIKILKIRGSLANFNIDHLLPIELTTSNAQTKKTFRLNLQVASDLSLLKHNTIKLNGLNAKNIIHLGNRNISRLNYVFSAFTPLDSPEYFYIDRTKKDKIIVEVNHLKLTDKSFKKTSIPLSRKRKIIILLKGDYNLDQQEDYLLLAREVDGQKQIFYLYYFNKDFKPLWSEKSIFRLEPKSLSFFLDNKSLLEFDQGKPIFNFIKYQHPTLGPIMVPLVKKRGYLPEEDNVTDLFDFEMPTIKQRNYLLIPNTNDGTLTQRALLSIPLKQEIEEELGVLSWEQLKIEGYLKNNTLKTGRLDAFISFGENLNRRYALLKFNAYQNYQIQFFKNIPSNIILSSNNLFTSESINRDADNKTIFFSLYEGHQARSIYFNQDQKIRIQKHNSSSWSDPFMGFIGAHIKDEEHISWLESRYWIYYFNNQKKAMKIAINRESSFPGIEFSETMKTVIINNQDKLSSGVFVNSTLLYGNQLYSILNKDSTLTRPISLTVQIPSNCTYMNPGYFKTVNYHSYILICDDNGTVQIKKIPMKI